MRMDSYHKMELRAASQKIDKVYMEIYNRYSAENSKKENTLFQNPQ